MKVSEAGLDLIRAEEGLRLHAYPDPASDLARATPNRRWGFEPADGIRAQLPVAVQLKNGSPWTLGYGNTRRPDGRRFLPGDTCTKAEAEAWLRLMVEGVENVVRQALQRPVTQPMWDALISIAWNVGEHNLADSRLMELINAGQLIEATREFDRWNKAGGRVEPGLVKRRDREQEMFRDGIRQALTVAGNEEALASFEGYVAAGLTDYPPQRLA
jgi:lysozyme